MVYSLSQSYFEIVPSRGAGFNGVKGLIYVVLMLRDLFPDGGDVPAVTIAKIQETVSERFSLSVTELVSPRRSQAVAYPRQVAMYLSRELTDSSLPKIGKEFGGRDHTTVIHATTKITRLINEDRTVYNLVQELTARLKQVK